MARLQVWNFSMGHQGYNGSSVNAWCAGPNSAGGVSVQFSFKNLTDKTIKYASFWCVPINRVNDIVSCTISRKSEKGVRVTGPIAPGASSTGNLWENAWYNHSINNVRMLRVYLEFMDGTTETVPAAEIDFSAPQGAGGCYVATAVYGSYDCPQVWTLRRYRDYTLAETWYGRAFIRTYYAVSPTLVKWFGKTQWFRKLWKGKLDKMVAKLQAQGVEATPYQDRNW